MIGRPKRSLRRPLIAGASLLLVAGLLGLLWPVRIGHAVLDVSLRARGWSKITVETPHGEVGMYERGGPEPPIVLVHGFIAEAAIWAPTMLRMDRTHRILVPDLPGAGFPGPVPEPATIAALTRTVEEALDAAGAKEAIVVGNSLGGWISMRLALDRPDLVRALVLVDSAGIVFDPPPHDLLLPADVEGFDRAWKVLHARMDPPPAFLTRALLRMRDVEGAERLLESMESGREVLDDRLADLRVPTLVVWGDADGLIPPEVGRRLARGIPGATFRGLPDCGHVPQTECAEEFTELLEAFVDQLAAGPPREK